MSIYFFLDCKKKKCRFYERFIFFVIFFTSCFIKYWFCRWDNRTVLRGELLTLFCRHVQRFCAVWESFGKRRSGFRSFWEVFREWWEVQLGTVKEAGCGTFGVGREKGIFQSRPNPALVPVCNKWCWNWVWFGKVPVYLGLGCRRLQGSCFLLCSCCVGDGSSLRCVWYIFLLVLVFIISVLPGKKKRWGWGALAFMRHFRIKDHLKKGFSSK